MSEKTPADLSALRFRNSADASLKAAAKSSAAAAFKTAFNKSVSKRRKRFDKEFSATPLLAVWSVDSWADKDDPVIPHLGRIARAASEGAQQAAINDLVDVVADAFSNARGIPSPIQIIVAAELIVRYGKLFSDTQFASVFVSLALLDVHRWVESSPTAKDDSPPEIASIIQSAEVPQILSMLLESLQISKAWGGPGVKQTAAALDASTDNDGTLTAPLARRADSWLAPFVRISAWSHVYKTEWATKTTQNRWGSVVERLTELVTSDGLITHTHDNESSTGFRALESTTLLAAAARHAGLGAASPVVSLLNGVGRRKKKSKKQSNSVRASNQSDWAESAVLRRGMTVDSDVIYLDWDENDPHLSLAVLGTKFFSGDWTTKILVNGTEHENAGSWVCTCWFEDKEVAFAELESGSGDGIRHVRHVMLSLKEHFALITESVTSPNASDEIQVTSQLKVVDGIASESNTITRELLLQSDVQTTRVVPVWLEDDRIHQAMGDCVAEGDSLQMTATSVGGLTMPLLLDWHPERMAFDADWNRLTVTEDRRVATSCSRLVNLATFSLTSATSSRVAIRPRGLGK